MNPALLFMYRAWKIQYATPMLWIVPKNHPNKSELLGVDDSSTQKSGTSPTQASGHNSIFGKEATHIIADKPVRSSLIGIACITAFIPESVEFLFFITFSAWLYFHPVTLTAPYHNDQLQNGCGMNTGCPLMQNRQD